MKEAYTELKINKSHYSHRTRMFFMEAEILQIVLPAEYVKGYTSFKSILPREYNF